MTDDVKRQGMMCKRAQGRSSMGRTNWKDRFFVLSATSLSYWDGFGGPTNNKATKKGEIELKNVRACEPVDDSTFKKPHMIQIVYDIAILYTQAADEPDRELWLKHIREQCQNNVTLSKTFHPGMYQGKWTCCSSAYRSQDGCKHAFDYKTLAGHKTQSGRTASDPVPPVPGAANGAVSAKDIPLPETPNSKPRGSEPVAGSAAFNVPTPDEFDSELEDGAFKVVVMYNYAAAEVSDISVREGDQLIILECAEEHWWKARTADGQEGFIPSNYVRRHGLEAEPWFHGRMGRSEAAAKLRVVNQEGCFLVRESESKPGEYSLSVSHGESLRHYHIKNQDSLHYINERHRFPTISKLVEYHKLNSGGLVTRLRKALSEVHAPVTAGLGHSKWEIDQHEIQLGKELGSGQFGVVMEGLYRNHIKVAVKMMKKDTMSEDDFISEAQVMKNFSHPNLVQLYGVCTAHRPIYIVTELMSQGCLLDYLRNNQHLSNQPEVIHYLCLQAAAAMVYLEAKKFIHRDLAARNCLVGESYVIKVADFGLARYVLDDEYTASEGTKFPIKWAAPEVIDFARFSTKSDVWSFGILLWELWTIGRTPYPSFTNVEVVQKVVDGYRLSRPPASTHEMHQLMLDCWHHDPEFRPTFAEVKQRLEERQTDYADMEDTI